MGRDGAGSRRPKQTGATQGGILYPARAPCYPDLLVFWYWFFVGPALLLALLSLRGERKRFDYVAARLAALSDWLSPATVIVPVKGEDDGLRENLAALAALDYPEYELI